MLPGWLFHAYQPSSRTHATLISALSAYLATRTLSLFIEFPTATIMHQALLPIMMNS